MWRKQWGKITRNRLKEYGNEGTTEREREKGGEEGGRSIEETERKRVLRSERQKDTERERDRGRKRKG